MPTTLQDEEFGTITIRRSGLAHNVRLKMGQNGALSISLPKFAPLYLAKRLLEQARPQIRRKIATAPQSLTLLHAGDLIGKSHRLQIAYAYGTDLSSRLADTTLHVTMPQGSNIESVPIQTFIKQAALKALRKQAKAYLTRRLAALAEQYGFTFSGTRFSNAGTRWGSCSSTGTISMNIWLMQLPFELIDYVLIHELCHTREMNHSLRFWSHVAAILPNYKQLRRDLKLQHPYL